MNNLLLISLLGIIAGSIDIIPMIKMKLDIYSIASAFMHYLIAAYMIAYTTILSDTWWLKGSVIAVVLAIPVLLIIAKEDKKALLPMVLSSLVLGALIGEGCYFLL